MLLAVAVLAAVGAPDVRPSPAIVGDAMPTPLTATPGDAERGRAIVGDRQVGLCVLCHRVPEGEPRLQGDIGPDLRGVGARLDAGQLRLRVADARRLNPRSVMPAYLAVDGRTNVAAAYRGRPILGAQQIEDVVAYLTTLRGR